MAFIDNTMFEIKVSNTARNDTQNVAGKFATSYSSADPLAAVADCSAGILCTKRGLIKNEGYTGIYNGNTWVFTPGDDMSATMTQGTGVYACNTHDVAKVINGDLIYNIPANTLGLGCPAGEYCNFTEIIVGEQYEFGAGNFSTLPPDNTDFQGDTPYFATIDSNGLLVATDDISAFTGGLLFRILRTEPKNEGVTYWGIGYILEAMKVGDMSQLGN